MTVFDMSCFKSNIPVPIMIGWPIMIRSDTPLILSCLPCVAASKRKSVVFSMDANIIVESFILSTPLRVNPIIRPLHVITSESKLMCLGLTLTPWSLIVYVIWLMIDCLAASMPKHSSIYEMWLLKDFSLSTPSILRISFKPSPSA